MIRHYIFRLRSQVQQLSASRRSLSVQQLPGNAPVTIAGPILWSSSAILGIYVVAAYWELDSEMKDYQDYKRQRYLPTPMTFETLEKLRLQRMSAELARRMEIDVAPTDILDGTSMRKFDSLTRPEKAAWAAIGANITIHLASSWNNLGTTFRHLPSSGRNWTLLTSTFGHSGIFHLLVNMYVLNNFTWPVSRSKTFQGSTPHCVAFYLSSGILASLAYHMQAVAKPSYRYIPCLGASGAIMAMLGAFGMSYPDAGIGIILLPFYIPASQALVGLTVFEAYGTIFGTRLGLAHSAHLGGLLAGIGYVWNGNGSRFWQKTKLMVFHRLYEGK